MDIIVFLENNIIKYDENSNLIFERTVVNTKSVNSMTKCSFGITVDGSGITDRSFLEDPYFKVYDGQNANNSDNVARIKVFKTEYVKHNNQIWNLSAKYKKALNTILSAHDYKNWKILLNECIKESHIQLSQNDIDNFMNTVMPDYT